MTDYTRQTEFFTQLDTLVAVVGATVDVGDREPGTHSAAVEPVTSDSRQMQSDDLFAATPGERVHDAAFAASTVEAGANAVLTDTQEHDILCRDLSGRSVPVLVIDDPRAAVGKAAALILDEPVADLDSYAVTGASGKTATVYMVESILGALGRESDLIGTVEIRLTGMNVPAYLMTPMPDELQSYLAFHRRGGGTDVVMETSGHALVQGRDDLVRFTVAGFTNLTQDHLDLHDTVERYYQAKANLLAPERTRNAVVSADGEYGRQLLAEYAPRLEGEVAALAADSGLPDLPDNIAGWRAPAIERLSFVLESTDGRRLATSTSLSGDSNVTSAALAAVMAMTTGYSPDELACALPTGINPAILGRTEVLNVRPRVIVDFVHSTEVFVSATKVLRPSTERRLVMFTGSTGDRDKGKRPAISAAVARYGDFVYIMDDGPHNEDPAVIRATVIGGTRGFGAPIVEIADRSRAIDAAIAEASERDTTLLVGRGYETIQEVVGVPIKLDDRVET